MNKEPSAHQIRELLRRADPLLDEDGPDEIEVAHLRRAVLAEIRPAAKSWSLVPAMAAAVLLLVALHAGFTLFESRNRAADPSVAATSRSSS